MTAAPQIGTLVTAAEFWRMPDDGVRRELVAGEVIETMPPGGKHGAIAAKLASRILAWAELGLGGYVGVEAGFVLFADPDTVRAPDVAFVNPVRIPADGIPDAFWPLAPDLAIEVVSPHDSADLVQEKVRDYLSAGTSLVWVVYPRSSEVLAYTPDGQWRTFGLPDTLEAPDVLPGFACPVTVLFR
jgi:Uma2 family endonuclease